MAARRERVDVTNDSKNGEIEIEIRVQSIVTNRRNVDRHPRGREWVEVGAATVWW
jgi:polyisoprenoid-binding protein YceI